MERTNSAPLASSTHFGGQPKTPKSNNIGYCATAVG